MNRNKRRRKKSHRRKKGCNRRITHGGITDVRNGKQSEYEDGKRAGKRTFLSRDYLHAVLGWERHTTDRYTCSDLVASILKAGGRLYCYCVARSTTTL